MIFVTVGSQRFQFPRLFQMVDSLIEKNVIREKVIAQAGYTKFSSTNMVVFDFLQPEEMERYIQSATIVVTHAGIGTITECFERNKKVIVVPRVQEFNEHIDNHQMEISNAMERKNLIKVARNELEFEQTIKNMEQIELDKYVKSESDLIRSLKDYINNHSYKEREVALLKSRWL